MKQEKWQACQCRLDRKEEHMNCKIIAEIAQGYEGHPLFSELYIKAAAKAGADSVKFQVVYADDLAEPGYEYYELFKSLEMDVAVWKNLRAIADDLGIKLYADILGDQAIDLARQVRFDGLKIHSTDFFNRKIVKECFDLCETVFISLGGIEEKELDELMVDIQEWGKMSNLVLLYGFQAEPTPLEKSNLARLTYIKNKFPETPVGYLDHTEGGTPESVHLSAMAMAIGADYIEKHLTLNRYLEIEDYVSGLEPEEFASYVSTMKNLQEALGASDFILSDAEKTYRDKALKKILIRSTKKAGDTVSMDDFVFKRSSRIEPFEGFHNPLDVVGKTVAKDMDENDPVLKECLS